MASTNFEDQLIKKTNLNFSIKPNSKISIPNPVLSALQGFKAVHFPYCIRRSLIYKLYQFGLILMVCGLFCRVITQMVLPQFRLATIPLDWSASEGNIFHCGRLPITLSRKFKGELVHCLSACVIRKSTLRKAGKGVFLSTFAIPGQILLKYGGRRLSFPEADRLKALVCFCL